MLGSLEISMVPKAGLEPARRVTTLDFEFLFTRFCKALIYGNP